MMDWTFLKNAAATKPEIDIGRITLRPSLTAEFDIEIILSGTYHDFSDILEQVVKLQNATDKFIRALDSTPVIEKTIQRNVGMRTPKAIHLVIPCGAYFNEAELIKAYAGSRMAGKSAFDLAHEFLRFAAAKHGL